MKKLKELQLKKVTLRDLDEPTMQGMAGGQHKPQHPPRHRALRSVAATLSAVRSRSKMSRITPRERRDAASKPKSAGS